MPQKMRAALTQGICKLCSQEKGLLKSHYIPKALYASPKKKLEFATRVSKGIVEKEMRIPLLCEDCEQRFDLYGEKEVLHWIAAKSLKSFPLHDRLQVALPREEWPEYSRFSGADVGIDMDKFGYFALSLVWRGAVHDWVMFDGTVRPHDDLGDFLPPIQEYLLQKAALPPDTAIIVMVLSNDQARNIFTTPVINVEMNCLNFRFFTRGVLFRVMMGRHMPSYFRNRCCTSVRKCLFYGSARHRMGEVMTIFDKE